jgi:hypothetical protein
MSTKSNISPSKAAANDEEPAKISMMIESDEFLKKWSGPILLGPFLPAIFALISIMGGHIVLNTWTGYCGYALDGKRSVSL